MIRTQREVTNTKDGCFLFENSEKWYREISRALDILCLRWCQDKRVHRRDEWDLNHPTAPIVGVYIIPEDDGRVLRKGTGVVGSLCIAKSPLQTV